MIYVVELEQVVVSSACYGAVWAILDGVVGHVQSDAVKSDSWLVSADDAGEVGDEVVGC